MRFRPTFLLLLAAILLPLLSGCGKKSTPGKIPELSLKTYGGETYTFGPQDGKVTLVVFWATWCVPCIEEIPQLKHFQKTYAAKGFRVVSINIDDPDGESAPLLARQFEINYPVLIGDTEVENAFGGLRALPTSFLVGRDGTVKKRLEGLYPQEKLEALIVAEL